MGLSKLLGNGFPSSVMLFKVTFLFSPRLTIHCSLSIYTILIYVDDLLITSSNLELIQSTKLFLSTQFSMKDLGPIRYFLGIELDHTPQDLFLSQRKYISDLLDDYYMKDSMPLHLPMDSHLKLTTTTDVPLHNPKPYQKLVSKLIYLSITQPDIVFTVCTNPLLLIIKQLSECLDISMAFLLKAFCSHINLQLSSKHFVIVSGLVVLPLESPLMVSAYFWTPLPFLGCPKGKLLYQEAVLKQNIRQ